MAKERRLSFRGPGTGNIGNKQKAAFIQEYEVGAKYFGVFLYAATGNASNERFLPRFFGARGALASGSSNPFLLKFSRHGWDDSGRQNVFLFVRRCALKSRGLFDNQRPMAPLKESLPVFSSGCQRVSPGVPEWTSAEGPLTPFFDRTDTIGKRNSWMLSTNGRLKTKTLWFASRGGSPDGGAIGAREVFLVVS